MGGELKVVLMDVSPGEKEISTKKHKKSPMGVVEGCLFGYLGEGHGMVGGVLMRNHSKC
jgi:hypothetical protein